MTTDVQTQPPSPPPAAEESKGSWERLTGVLFSPDETFADIARRPNILLPLVVLLIVSIISAVLIVPRMDFEASAREQMERNPRTANLSPGDFDRAVRFGASMFKMTFYASPVLAIVIWAIFAGVLWIAFRLFGGEGTFKQAFAVTLYAWIPLLIKSIITTVVAFSKSGIVMEQLATLVASNPGFLLDPKENPVAFSFVSTFDIFVAWTLALLTIGFSHVSRMSKAKSAAIVLSLFGLLTLLKVGGAALGASKMKGASS